MRPLLFRPLEPYSQDWLDLGDGHRVYFEQCGNRDGIAVLVVHGGPGSGCNPNQRCFFDPQYYRIILFDQRGAGRSAPLGAVENNTTALIVEDMERLRTHLGISRWLLFGGSWGSTLSLAYAQSYPDAVHGLILRGIFLGTHSEIDWYLYGLKAFAPSAWHAFSSYVPQCERDDLLAAYCRRVHARDPRISIPAARAWNTYESAAMSIDVNEAQSEPIPLDDIVLGKARIQTHYLANECFLQQDQLVNQIDRVRRLPALMVQGSHDLICPSGASTLHRAWPEAEYMIVPGARHSAFDPKMARALVDCTERFKDRLA